MTEVKVLKNDSNYKINLSGHAGYAPGNDIVCSAISIVTYTLLQIVNDGVNAKTIKANTVKVQDGFVDIDVHVSRDYQSKFDIELKTLLTAYGLLNNKYPNNLFLDVSI